MGASLAAWLRSPCRYYLKMMPLRFSGSKTSAVPPEEHDMDVEEPLAPPAQHTHDGSFRLHRKPSAGPFVSKLTRPALNMRLIDVLEQGAYTSEG